MTGADRLCEALLVNHVDVCFTTTSCPETPLGAALGRQPRLRCVPCPVEGVATAAADGYGRMRERPAATLLPSATGLANGLANLHHARRAHTPVLAIVGDPATDHAGLGSPLSSDLELLAKATSRWVGRSRDVERVEHDVARAWTQSMAGGVATLIVPADIGWSEHTYTYAIEQAAPPRREPLQPMAFRRVAQALRLRRKVVLFLAGAALHEEPLKRAAAIAQATGARLAAQTANGRIARGRGRVPVARLGLTHETGGRLQHEAEMLVLIGAREPATPVAQRPRNGRLAAPPCEVIELARPDQDLEQAIAWLAEEVGLAAEWAPGRPATDGDAAVPTTAALTAGFINRLVAERLPDRAIVCDDMPARCDFYERASGAAPHDYLQASGGASGVGIALALATGAAVACPDRKVINLQAEVSGMQMVQALWTLARDKLDVLTIVFASRAVTPVADMRMPGAPGSGGRSLSDPVIDWAGMSASLGVSALRAESEAAFARALDGALAGRGPFLIEAVI